MGDVPLRQDNESGPTLFPMATCPRCGETYSDPPALSRTDNITDVCSMCGVGEALDAMEGEMVAQADWPIGRH